jgi:hypothetical protein
LNIAFMNESASGAGWQLIAQVFDSLCFGSIAAVVAWVAVLTRRPDPTTASMPPSIGTPAGA